MDESDTYQLCMPASHHVRWYGVHLLTCSPRIDVFSCPLMPGPRRKKSRTIFWPICAMRRFPPSEPPAERHTWENSMAVYPGTWEGEVVERGTKKDQALCDHKQVAFFSLSSIS